MRGIKANSLLAIGVKRMRGIKANSLLAIGVKYRKLAGEMYMLVKQ